MTIATLFLKNGSTRAIEGGILKDVGEYEVVDDLRGRGYEVIVSIGELEENRIGSNCGQYLKRYLDSRKKLDGGYVMDG